MSSPEFSLTESVRSSVFKLEYKPFCTFKLAPAAVSDVTFVNIKFC